MAFDNVTIFEVNLPSDPLSSDFGDGSDTSQAERRSDDDQTDSGGRSWMRLVPLGVALVGIAIAVRRMRSGEDDDIEMAYEEPGVEVEQHNS